KGFFNNIIKKTKTRQKDIVEVGLPGLCIKVSRNINLNVPHELTVIIPRAEMRKKCLNDDCSKYEYEVIYSSITIVHAPRHPLAGPSSPIPSEILKNPQK
ncbi:MAG TPA: hypothetical protein GX519_00365, partial [Thermoanaerobacterales bacterium]|nr:hypothetical protein [Thermoanaerobacterales bacterium]